MATVSQVSEMNSVRSHDPANRATGYTTGSKFHPAMTRKKHWLEVAEWISLGGSAVGAVMVGLSGQALYGVAPLTVTAFLNVANRDRLQKRMQETQIEMLEVHQSVEQMEKNAVRAILGVKHQLSGELTLLQRRVEEMPLEANRRAKQLALLGESVASIQDNVALALEESRQQVLEE
ncbi:MAG: hypothetical protein ACFBSC_15935 [Microcoleaceae cyanobacterium]